METAVVRAERRQIALLPQQKCVHSQHGEFAFLMGSLCRILNHEASFGLPEVPHPSRSFNLSHRRWQPLSKRSTPERRRNSERSTSSKSRLAIEHCVSGGGSALSRPAELPSPAHRDRRGDGGLDHCLGEGSIARHRAADGCGAGCSLVWRLELCLLFCFATNLAGFVRSQSDRLF